MHTESYMPDPREALCFQIQEYQSRVDCPEDGFSNLIRNVGTYTLPTKWSSDIQISLAYKFWSGQTVQSRLGTFTPSAVPGISMQEYDEFTDYKRISLRPACFVSFPAQNLPPTLPST